MLYTYVYYIYIRISVSTTSYVVYALFILLQSVTILLTVLLQLKASCIFMSLMF